MCQGWHANQLPLWLETARRPLDAYIVIYYWSELINRMVKSSWRVKPGSPLGIAVSVRPLRTDVVSPGV